MFVVVCALGLVVPSALATPLAINDGYYLGGAKPGTPQDAAAEVLFINALIAGQTSIATSSGIQTLTPSGYSCGGLCPAATVVGSTEVATAQSFDGKVDVTGWTYLTAFYGANSGFHVWYVGDLLDPLVSLPTSVQTTNPAGKPITNGISNYGLYNPASVRDGGKTLMLLGGALIGLESLRRRFRA